MIITITTSIIILSIRISEAYCNFKIIYPFTISIKRLLQIPFCQLVNSVITLIS